MLEDETDTESKEHIITILASLRSCPLFPIRMSTLCVNLTIINTLPLHLCSTWQLWEGGWGRVPLSRCNAVSALWRYSCNPILYCSAAVSLMLCYYICTEHRPTSGHSDTCPCHCLVQEEKEENLQNRGELIKKKRCTERIARQTSALGCPTSLQSSKWPCIQSRSIWSGFHCAKSDENKAM